MKKNRRFKLLLLVILTLIGAYVGFWFYVRAEVQRAFTDWVAAARSRGEQVTFESAEWGGFPTRLTLDVKKLSYAGSGREMEADSFHVEALPWQPTDFLMWAQGDIRLALREPNRIEWIEIRPATLAARTRFSRKGRLEGADIELKQLRADGTDLNGNDFSFNAGRMQFDARAAVDPAAAKSTEGTPVHDSYQLAFSVEQLMISEGFAPALGPQIERIEFVAWAKNLPAMAAKAWVPSPDEYIRQFQSAGGFIEIVRLEFDWGGVSGKATGRLDLDAELRPQGAIDFRINGLGKLIEALTRNGTLRRGAAPLPARFPDLPGGTPIPLTIRDGLVTFGPFIVGTVPSLS